MPRESVGDSMSKRGTNQFMRQGHTAGPYGQDPSKEAKGEAGKSPRELKP